MRHSSCQPCLSTTLPVVMPVSGLASENMCEDAMGAASDIAVADTG